MRKAGGFLLDLCLEVALHSLTNSLSYLSKSFVSSEASTMSFGKDDGDIEDTFFSTVFSLLHPQEMGAVNSLRRRLIGLPVFLLVRRHRL